MESRKKPAHEVLLSYLEDVLKELKTCQYDDRRFILLGNIDLFCGLLGRIGFAEEELDEICERLRTMLGFYREVEKSARVEQLLRDLSPGYMFPEES